MGARITIQDIQKSKVAHLNQHLFHKEQKSTSAKGKIVAKHFQKRSKEKDWIALFLFAWCQERSLQLLEEYQFDETRRWRSDYAIPDLKVLIEYEGMFSEKSRHTTASGYTGDSEKYNAAQALGWVVLRFTAINYKTLPAALHKHDRK